MTLEEVQALSDDELRIKVAELCGWKDLHWGNNHPNTMLYGWPPCSRYMVERCVPNYTQDLNAMREAESVFPMYDPKGYPTGNNQRMHDRFLGWLRDIAVEPVFATARQRAEAFVLTMEEK